MPEAFWSVLFEERILVVIYVQCALLLSQCVLHKGYSGDYSTGVPPLPIPNREVKPVHADGTAQVGE